MMFRDRTALAFVLVIDLAVGAGIGSAEEADARLEKMPAELTVKNPGPAVTPTLYLIGMPDRAAEPVRKTKGVRVNGVRLTETLLSESVLILYPDGTGRWGYHTGFDIFREPHWQDGRRIDPRTLIEYDKWRYDPLEPVYRVGGDMNLLRLYDGRRSRPARYEIAFPRPMLIRTLRVASNCDQLNRPGVVVTVRLWADRSRSELIGQKRVGHGQGAKRFPIVFEDVNRAGVVLELSAADPAGKPVDLYWTFFEAVLDAGGVSLPRLSSGVNRITVEDDPDSSHRVRLVLRWEDRPAADRVWDDFERSGRWRGGSVIKGSRADGLAFTGERFLRVTFPADGRSFGIERPVSGEDWSRFNRIGFAVRARQPAPMRAIALGIRNDEGRFQYLRFKPRARWRFFEFDISRLQRDRVTALRFHWFATPGFSRPEQPCQYDIDSLALWHEEAPPRPPSPSLPEHVARYRSPYDEVTPKARPVPPIQRWFPMGIYDGICSRSDQECRWLFDQMKRLHMNAVYVSNGRVEELERILPLAEARGIRLIYQGTGDGALYYLHLATRTARVQSYERTLAPRAKEWIPKFRDRWGLAAWSLTEEITPEIVAELGPYYRLVRELAPNQPPTVLHNNFPAALADLKQNRPAVITHDFYPFFWSPRSGPSNPRRSVAALRARASRFYKACREHGASLWMMVQAWGTPERRPLDPPHYGYRTGMRTPEPGEIKLQGWVSVAEGATGLFFYAALPSRPEEHQLWDFGWKETARTRAAGELFEQLQRVAPLLCQLERDYAEAGFVSTSNPKVIAHTFVRRKDSDNTGRPTDQTRRPSDLRPARYIVLASLDGFEPQRFNLSVHTGQRVFDLISRRDITDQLTDMVLPPGEGRVLLVGSRDDFHQTCRVIDSDGTRSQ